MFALYRGKLPLPAAGISTIKSSIMARRRIEKRPDLKFQVGPLAISKRMLARYERNLVGSAIEPLRAEAAAVAGEQM